MSSIFNIWGRDTFIDNVLLALGLLGHAHLPRARGGNLEFVFLPF